MIFVVLEPDTGGDAVKKWLRRSSIARRAKLVRLQDAKDPSALHAANPDAFRAAFQQALDEAEPFEVVAHREAEAAADTAKKAADDLLFEEDVLARFAAALPRAGLVGEDRNAKILFLALTSRCTRLMRPTGRLPGHVGVNVENGSVMPNPPVPAVGSKTTGWIEHSVDRLPRLTVWKLARLPKRVAVLASTPTPALAGEQRSPSLHAVTETS